MFLAMIKLFYIHNVQRENHNSSLNPCQFSLKAGYATLSVITMLLTYAALAISSSSS